MDPPPLAAVRRRVPRAIAAAVLAGSVLLPGPSAADQDSGFPVRRIQAPPGTRLVQELSFDPAGDHVTLQGKGFGKKLHIVLDTGAPMCTFGPAFRGKLGAPLGRTDAVVFDKRAVAVELFKAPAVRVGKLKVCSGGTLTISENPHPACARLFDDLADGLLGLEDLLKFVVQIDYDAGKVRLFQPGSSSPDWGPGIPMDYPKGSQAVVIGRLPGGIDEEFMLDTGGGNTLAPELFSRLAAAAGRTPLASGGCDMAGLRKSPWVEVEGFSMGGVSYPPMNFESVELGGRSVLGHEFFRRHLVTFDFPNSRLHLKPGRRFLEPDRGDFLGAGFLQESSTRTIVAFVAEGSPAAAAAMKEGDELVAVDGKPPSSWDDVGLSDYFASTSLARAVLTLRREGQEMKVPVVLDRSWSRQHAPLPPVAEEAPDPGPGPWLLAETSVTGIHRLAHAEVLSLLGARKGRRYDPESLKTGISRLYGHPAVAKASVDIEPVAARPARRPRAVRMRVSVEEKHLVRSVSLPPVLVRLGQEGLLTAPLVSTGSYLDPGRLAEDAARFEEVFRIYGRPEAQVRARVDIDTAAHAADVRYLLAVGGRQGLKDVVIKGNRAFPGRRLLDAMGAPLDDVYSDELLQGSLKKLRSFYLEQGYWDVDLGTASVTISRDRSEAALRIDLTEGKRRLCGEARVSGNAAFTSQELAPLVAMRAGEPCPWSERETAWRRLALAYAEKGFIQARFRQVFVFDSRSGLTDAAYRIVEGKPFSFARVDLEGVVDPRRRAQAQERILVKPGDTFSRTRVLESRERLEKLPWARNVEVDLEPSMREGDWVDLIYEITER